MQRLISASLFALLITVTSATISPAQTRVEQEIAATQRTATTQVMTAELTPFDLVSLAYQGHYKAQNIPSNGALLQAVEDQSVTPQQLVQAAIALHELPAETLNNQTYLSQVKAQILGLTVH